MTPDLRHDYIGRYRQEREKKGEDNTWDEKLYANQVVGVFPPAAFWTIEE